MGKQISLGSIQDLTRLGELEKMFNYFGLGLEITVPLEDGPLYSHKGWRRVKGNIHAIKEYIGSQYQVNPQVSVADGDEDGNIDTVKYSVVITSKRRLV